MKLARLPHPTLAPGHEKWSIQRRSNAMRCYQNGLIRIQRILCHMEKRNTFRASCPNEISKHRWQLLGTDFHQTLRKKLPAHVSGILTVSVTTLVTFSSSLEQVATALGVFLRWTEHWMDSMKHRFVLPIRLSPVPKRIRRLMPFRNKEDYQLTMCCVGHVVNGSQNGPQPVKMHLHTRHRPCVKISSAR